jgi:hypothetical protein
MQRAERKTALFFHAKDDLPEVRYEVFRLLRRHTMTFHAVVRDKRRVVEDILRRNEEDPAYRYKENDLYDEMVSALFRDSFHRGDHLAICFARRGNRDRTEALERALQNARRDFEERIGATARATTKIWASTPEAQGGL